MDDISFPIHDGFINYLLVVFNMNDKIVYFYDSESRGESDSK